MTFFLIFREKMCYCYAKLRLWIYVFAYAEVDYFKRKDKIMKSQKQKTLPSFSKVLCLCPWLAIRQCGAAAAKIKQITNIYEVYRWSQSVMTLAL